MGTPSVSATSGLSSWRTKLNLALMSSRLLFLLPILFVGTELSAVEVGEAI